MNTLQDTVKGVIEGGPAKVAEMLASVVNLKFSFI